MPARSLAALAALAAFALACTPAPSEGARTPHGTLSNLSSVEGEITLCDHRVPATVCTRHHPELVPNFKKVGDWCTEHDVAESQCLVCNPDLTFRALPKLPPEADVKALATAGEDVGELAPLAAPGKVTVFEFYADWCAVCRKVDAHVYEKFARGEADFAYRKLNVVDWDSPLGRRFLKDVPGLPLVVVYRADGKPSGAVYGADLPLLDRTIAAAKAP
jgi:thiol-disulfide isomerase/thioredoxin